MNMYCDFTDDTVRFNVRAHAHGWTIALWGHIRICQIDFSLRSEHMQSYMNIRNHSDYPKWSRLRHMDTWIAIKIMTSFDLALTFWAGDFVKMDDNVWFSFLAIVINWTGIGVNGTIRSRVKFSVVRFEIEIMSSHSHGWKFGFPICIARNIARSAGSVKSISSRANTSLAILLSEQFDRSDYLRENTISIQ